MDNTSALGAIRRRWWILLLLAVVGAALAALPETKRVEQQVTRSFNATHTMLVNDSDSVSGGSSVSPNQVGLLATVGEVPQRVADLIDYDGNAAQLASGVTVEFDYSTGALTFETTQASAQQAEIISNAFAEETNRYLAERQDVAYQERLAATFDRLEALENDLDDLTAQLGSDPDNPALKAQRDAISRQYSVAFEQSQTLTAAPPVIGFTTLQRAQAIEVTKSTGIDTPTSRGTRAMMGLAAGLAMGVAAAALLGRLDRRIRTREQAEEVLGMRARVIVPMASDDKVGGLVVVTGRHDPLSDSYRTLRNVVSFVQNGLEPVDHAWVTLVVSPGPGDGKTSAAANLAAAFVESGERTVVVNTDFRRPRLAAAVRETPPTRLPYELEDLGAVRPQSLLVPTDLQGMLLMDLSTIDATPGELARATAHQVSELSLISNAIVIDTSPVGATAEVLDLVPLADIIVVVARVGHTSIEAASRTVAVLRDLTTAPMVLALNGLKQARAPYYEYTDRRNPDDGHKSLLDRFLRVDEPV
jgi:Mrp family chromosome partitioning ATPase/capsular polysaccharide biosynthesis protein